MRATADRLVLMAFLLLALGACSGGADPTPQESVDQGKTLMKKGDLKGASIALRNALRAEGEHVEARWLLGQVYLRDGNGAAAEKELRVALQLGLAHETGVPALARSLLLQKKLKAVLDEIRPPEGSSEPVRASVSAMRAAALLGQGQFEQARAVIDDALASDPTNLHARLFLARINLSQGRVEEAASVTAELGKEYPDEPDVLTLRGDLAMARRDLEGAESAYGGAVEVRGWQSDRFSRMLVRLERGDLQGADADLKELEKLGARNPIAAYGRGVWHFLQQRYPESQTRLEDALRGAPDYLPALFYLGASHFMQGHDAQAQQFLGQVLARAPGSAGARRMLGALHLRGQRLDDAYAVLRPLVSEESKDNAARHLLARVLFARGRTDEGIEMLERAVEIAPDSAESRMLLGQSLLALGQDAAGESQLQKAITLQPDQISAETVLVLSSIRNGKHDKALATARALRARHPENPMSWNLEGLALDANKQEEAARGAFLKAMEVSPGDPFAAMRLATMELRRDNVDGARGHYQAALKVDPGNLRVRLLLAATELAAGRRAEARDNLERAVRDNPTALGARLALARFHVSQREPDQALAVLQQAGKNHAGSPALLQAVGELQLAMGQEEKALHTMRALALARPDSADAQLVFAQAALRAGDLEAAEQALSAGAGLAPADLRLRMLKAGLAIKRERYADAAAEIEEIAALEGGEVPAWTLRGELSAARKKFGDAAAAYRKAFAARPTSMLAQNLVRVLWWGGERAAAVTEGERWLASYPDDSRVRLVLADLALRSGDTELARRHYEVMLERFPDDMGVLNNLAELYADSDLERALEFARRAYDIASESPVVADTYGWLLLRSGDTTRAGKLLEQALSGLPGNPAVAYHYARLLAAKGDSEGAERHLRSALGTGQFRDRAAAEALLAELTGGR